MLLIYNAQLHKNKDLKAILIVNDIIKEIGLSDDLVKKYPTAKKIDVKGKLVLPGFNDSHLHLVNYAKIKKRLQLYHAKSIAEVIELGKKYHFENPGIIIANGYNDDKFIEKRLLTRNDLDIISRDVPIIAYRICGHIASINTKAIEILELTKESYFVGGAIDLDDNQQLTGILRENALDILSQLTLVGDNNELKSLILDALKDVNKYGITSINTNDISGSIEYGNKIYQAYYELAEENQLTARVNHQISYQNLDELSSFLKDKTYSNPYFKLGPLKLFIDGSLGGKTAYLMDNYLNDNARGILCIPLEELDEIMRYANHHHLQVIIHAIGDQGIKICLDAFSKANLHYTKEKNPLRHGIVHVQITNKELLSRFHDLQILALVQPPFINSDMNIIYQRVKKKLADTSYAFKTLYDYTMTAFGSDAPIENFNPLLGIYHSCTRANLEYNQFFNLDQKTSVEEAIAAYTINGAYLSFEEDVKGLIKEGYYGDLVVLEENIFLSEPKNIKEIEVAYTILGGKIVYQKE